MIKGIFPFFGKHDSAGLRDLRGHTGQVGFHPSPDRYLMRRANSNQKFFNHNFLLWSKACHETKCSYCGSGGISLCFRQWCWATWLPWLQPANFRKMSFIPTPTSRDETMQFCMRIPLKSYWCLGWNCESPYEIQPWLVGDEFWWFNISGISERDDIWPGRVNHQH